MGLTDLVVNTGVEQNALSGGGLTGVDVRQGKRFELEVDDSVTAEDLEKVAATLLANTVIEDYEVVGLEVK